MSFNTGIGVALILAALGGGQDGGRPRQAVPEYELKAQLLFKIATFAMWPDPAFESEDSPLEVGVLGEDPFGPELDKALRDREVEGHGIKVRRSNRVEDLRRVHVLFVSRAEAHRLPAVLEAARGGNMLVFGESRGFASAGGAVNLVRQGTKIEFEINPNALNRAGLGMHPTVLKLAKIVRDGE